MTESKAVVLVLFWLLKNLGSVMSRDPYFLKETEVIPRNAAEYMMMTEDLKCEGKNMSVAYVLHSIEMKTLMVCTPNETLSEKWCPEFNSKNSLTGKIQSKMDARCTNMSIAPCKGIYSVWDSYLFFECFQEFGGISSPMECVQNLKLCEERYKNAVKVVDEKENIINELQQDIEAYKNSSENYEQKLELCEEKYKNVSQVVDEKEDIINEMSSKNCDKTFDGTVHYGKILTILFAIILCCLLLHIFLFLYLIKKFYYKENITYRKYIESRKILLKNLFTSVSDISVGIGRAENRSPHKERTLALKAMNVEEVEKEQEVDVDEREVDNQHLKDTVVTVEGTNQKLWG